MKDGIRSRPSQRGNPPGTPDVRTRVRKTHRRAPFKNTRKLTPGVCGGVKRGFVHGASDKTGSYPAENPVRPDDLAATIYQALGIDPHTILQTADARPVHAADGNPISAIFA